MDSLAKNALANAHAVIVVHDLGCPACRRKYAASEQRDIGRVALVEVRRAHGVLAEHAARPQSKPDELFHARCPASPYLVKLLRLAMLAPDIQRAILEGRQPKGLTLQQLLDAEIPVSWAEQRAVLAFPAA